MKPLHEIVGVVIILSAVAIMLVGVCLGIFGRHKRTDKGFVIICAAGVLLSTGLWAGGGWKIGLFGFVGIVGIWLPLYYRYYWK